jgi:hypothetical protein
MEDEQFEISLAASQAALFNAGMFCTGRELNLTSAFKLLKWSQESSTLRAERMNVTFPEHGGVVREPSYLRGVC